MLLRRLTTGLLQQHAATPCGQEYRDRFGSLSRAYELMGYSSRPNGWLETRRRIQALRSDLMTKIVELNPARIEIEDLGYRYRDRLRTHDGRPVSDVASRPRRRYKNIISWLVRPRQRERRLSTLVARLSVHCDAFKDMFLLPGVVRLLLYLREYDQRLQNAIRVTKLEDFCGTINRLRKLRTSNWNT